METLQQCPTCATRTRPGDAWCPVCYTRLVVVPETPPAPVVPGRAGVADDPRTEQDDPQDVEQDAARGATRSGRREQRVDFESLANSMVAELAATESGVKLPDSLERAFDSVGLSSDVKGRRIAGMAAAFGAALLVGVVLMWIVGLVL